jgi:hypothetical protein
MSSFNKLCAASRVNPLLMICQAKNVASKRVKCRFSDDHPRRDTLPSSSSPVVDDALDERETGVTPMHRLKRRLTSHCRIKDKYTLERQSFIQST